LIASALAELRRLGTGKPFSADSPDVYPEPKSLNRLFTDGFIVSCRQRLFGYDMTKGSLDGTGQIEVLKTSAGACCQNAYRVALEQALQAQGLVLRPRAPHQIGVSIVGVEPQETPNTLAGVMVEAYLTNNVLKKSFFIRYGAGHPRSLAAAIRLSAEMLVMQIVSRAGTSHYPGPALTGPNVSVKKEK
jgi:hypothetical protein